MFNPHIHQQQQQQQFHQHLRQIRQLFQQQPPPPPPQPPPGHHVPHHHQTPRPMPVPPQTAPPPRMVNLCQATQTTIIAPNPMLQGAILMQQMQGNMRGFGMGGQQFRQFFAGGTRSSLLGPVPMGMAIKSPIMGFPAARPFHPHARFYNNTATTSVSSSSVIDPAARPPDRKRDVEQMAGGGTDDQPAAAASSSNEENKTPADGPSGGAEGPSQLTEEQPEEPVAKKLRTEGSERPSEPCGIETVTTADTHGEGVSLVHNWRAEDIQSEGPNIVQDEGSTEAPDGTEVLKEAKNNEVHSCQSALSPSGRLSEDEQQVNLPAEETQEEEEEMEEEEEEESVAESSNKFYCYLCSITCHNQQNFRSHMNSISHQQRMMEIQHMSNACLVTLLPRVQESLQGASKDGEKKDMKRWCSTCQTYFTCSILEHHRTEEHKLASRTDMSSCAVCKKHFKNSQSFLEHLQSHEHRQKLHEKGCEALAKLTALDTDGFSLEEEEEGSEMEEGDGTQRNKGDGQDGWSSLDEMTINNLPIDEQHDPDTVYGSSFLVPVAGFICRLCNKFYHFESSALHTHCKSLKHFNNLKRYQALMSQKDEAVGVADSPRPQTETTPVCPDESWLSSDPGLSTDLNSKQPIITLTRLKMEKQQQEKEAEPDPSSQDFTTVSATSTGNSDKDLSLHQEDEDKKEEEEEKEKEEEKEEEEEEKEEEKEKEKEEEKEKEKEEEEDPSQESSAQESPAELPADSREEADSESAAAAEETNEDEAEKEAPAGPGKKNGTGKAKATTKRRSGRVTNKR